MTTSKWVDLSCIGLHALAALDFWLQARHSPGSPGFWLAFLLFILATNFVILLLLWRIVFERRR
jgi:hypothetical protein